MPPDLGILAEDLEYHDEGQHPVWQCEGCLTYFTDKQDLLALNHAAEREGIEDADVKGECPYCNGLCREKLVSEADFSAIQEVS